MKNKSENLLKLAQEIQPHFPSYYLADRTAIMLRHHHRVSVDLDFFFLSFFFFPAFGE